MKKYLYFPGCSLKGTGKAYEESLLAVFRGLGVELKEIEDWNCCGATAYMSVDEAKSYALAGRNLAIAERDGRKDVRPAVACGTSDTAGEYLDVIAPCSACYLGLNKAQKSLQDHPDMLARVNKALAAAGLRYQGKVKVRHPLDVLVNDIGLENIRKKITRQMSGHRFAPYYGCQIVRPFATFDDQYEPKTMDQLLAMAGAECVNFPLKTRCCGGSLTGTVPEVGLRLAYIILKEAQKRGAQAVVTVCPLCQFNLDGYQDKIASKFEAVNMPVVYFTQILGLALGLSADELGLKRSIIPAEAVLAGR